MECEGGVPWYLRTWPDQVLFEHFLRPPDEEVGCVEGLGDVCSARQVDPLRPARVRRGERRQVVKVVLNAPVLGANKSKKMFSLKLCKKI